ncbi:hypothetical protein [Fibrobacter sp.]|uniref:hypothetical protein n=1 Tax=Fibrobacter sp. TaxID=35828 RepID=UPI0038665045
MDDSIEVFTKLQTFGMIIVPLFAICLFGLMKDELGLDYIGKDLDKLMKSFKKRLNSTELVTKLSTPDEMELRVLSELQLYFNTPNHSHSVIQHSRCVEFQNWDCAIYGDLYLITQNGRLATLARLLNDNGFSISYEANDMCGGQCWHIWKASSNEKPTFLCFQ